MELNNQHCSTALLMACPCMDLVPCRGGGGWKSTDETFNDSAVHEFAKDNKAEQQRDKELTHVYRG
jgi:hypothetical protein